MQGVKLNRSMCAFSGLENLFLLTMRKKNELRVDMEDFEGGKASAQYSSFSIGPENSGYQLYLGSFSAGVAGEDYFGKSQYKYQGIWLNELQVIKDVFNENVTLSLLGFSGIKTCIKWVLKSFIFQLQFCIVPTKLDIILWTDWRRGHRKP